MACVHGKRHYQNVPTTFLAACTYPLDDLCSDGRPLIRHHPWDPQFTDGLRRLSTMGINPPRSMLPRVDGPRVHPISGGTPGLMALLTRQIVTRYRLPRDRRDIHPCTIVTIVGSAGSGKSVFASRLSAALSRTEIPADDIVMVDTDGFFVPRKERHEKMLYKTWERTDSKRFRQFIRELQESPTIHIPYYSSIASSSLETDLKVIAGKVVIVEGILAPEVPSDFKVQLMASDRTRFDRISTSRDLPKRVLQFVDDKDVKNSLADLDSYSQKQPLRMTEMRQLILDILSRSLSTRYRKEIILRQAEQYARNSFSYNQFTEQRDILDIDARRTTARARGQDSERMREILGGRPVNKLFIMNTETGEAFRIGN